MIASLNSSSDNRTELNQSSSRVLPSLIVPSLLHLTNQMNLLCQDSARRTREDALLNITFRSNLTPESMSSMYYNIHW